MLESFRRVATHMVIKIFLVFIALSFVLWGVGDIFRGHTDTDVAKIGKESIPRLAFDQELRLEVARMQRRFGVELTPEQIKAMKLEEMVLNRLINRRLVEMAGNDMGIRVGIPAVLSHIQSDSGFQNAEGVFDKKIFDALLETNNLNEASYVALLRKDMASDFLLDSLSAVKIVPTELVNRIYQYKNEKRVVEGLKIPHDRAITIPAAKEAELKAFYESHKQQFITPEMRSLSYITLSVDDLLEGIATSETEARTEYDDNISNYEMPERRSVDNLVFTEEAQAKAAWEQLKSAKHFTAKANELTKQTEKDRLLENIAKTDLPAEGQNAVFELEKNAFTSPIKTSLGWHIFRVTNITPASTATFEEVKEQIMTALTRKKAENSLLEYSKKLEDEFASGSTLEEVATKLGLKVRTIENVTKEGTDQQGEKLASVPPFGNFLPVAFSSEEGNEPALTLAPDNATYFVIRVNKIAVPRTLSWEEAQTQLMNAFQAEQKKQALAKRAEGILQQVKTGTDIEQLARLEQIEFLPPKQVERPVDTFYGEVPSPLPQTLLKELFTLKQGGVTGLHQTMEGDYIIGVLKEIVAAPPKNDTQGLEQVRFDLGRRFNADITEQYMRHLHKRYPVTITLETKKQEQAN